jgi:Protein of unknown function (DUF3035)
MIQFRKFRSLVLTSLVLSSSMALAGCGGSDGISRTFGLTRDAPDEFEVTTRAPLSMPPDFSLRPPQPGAPRPQEQTATQATEAVLAPGTVLANPNDAATSPGQQALVNAAGPQAPADIRREVNAQTALDAPGHSFTDRLIFWRSTPQPGVVVDPSGEAQRLRANAALGQAVTQGDTPIIQPRKDDSLFGNLF